MDSYYLDSAARKLLEDSGIYYSASVKADFFKTEVRTIHKGGQSDSIGEWKGLYNDTTSQLFVYHFDRQKGVGKKYNFSHGFKRYTDKRKISECKEMIPAYDYYKTFFECCDNFNRGLKDKHWPHKRGGKGTKGEYGNHNDFFLACILQNTFNSWCAVTNTDYKSITFQAFCDDLAEQIVLFSSKL
jgi:hypothetical protein